MHKADIAKDFSNTNQTFIDIVSLGQILALSKGIYQWAAKPSEIFLNMQNHDEIFSNDIPDYPYDIVAIINLFKAAKRALKNYLEKPTHYNENTLYVFNKPIVLAYVYRTALLYHYQKCSLDGKYYTFLNKNASPTLVDELEKIYSKFITKTKVFYLSEKAKEVSSKKLNEFFNNLYIDLGIDVENDPMPFTERTYSREYSEY